MYRAAQLLLNRELAPDDLPALFPPLNAAMSAGAVLSADLCLRMLPSLLIQLRIIDPEDALADLLDGILSAWHYSAVGYRLPAEDLDFRVIAGDACALQLYADRVIEAKDKNLAARPELAPSVAAAMGDYSRYFWPS